MTNNCLLILRYGDSRLRPHRGSTASCSFRMRASILLVFIFSVVPTLAQTASEVEKKYGKPVYSVSEHIWMIPDYSVDGQVCRMRLYPKRVGGKVDYPDSALWFPELTAVLNEIAPPHLRGPRKNGFGHSTSGGGVISTTYAYENFEFTFFSSFKLDPGVLEKIEAYVLTGPDLEDSPTPKQTPPSLDDFASSKNFPNRKCDDRLEPAAVRGKVTYLS